MHVVQSTGDTPADSVQMLAGESNVVLVRVDRRYVGAQSGQTLGEQATAAADVQQTKLVQWQLAVHRLLAKSPVGEQLLADQWHTQFVQIPQWTSQFAGVPVVRVGGEFVELVHLLLIDAFEVAGPTRGPTGLLRVVCMV